jgi:hypothetical protein
MDNIIPGPNNSLITGSLATPPNYSRAELWQFTPTTGADWDTAPTTVQAALDEIAARVRSLEP